jgi:hypothetical protein
MEDLAKIKDRIVKLLAMSKDASSPEEAAIAAKRARTLMDKHQLAEYDLLGKVAESFAKKKATRFFAAMPMYLQFLATSIARYNDCQAVFEGGWVDFKKKQIHQQQWGKAILFRGYESDVDLSVQMYQSMTEAVDRLCKEFLLDKGYNKYPVRIGGQFKLGAIMVIGNRIREMLAEREQLALEGKRPGEFEVGDYADDMEDEPQEPAEDEAAPEASTSRALSLVDVKKASVEEHFGKVETKTVNVKGDRDKAEAEARRSGYQAGAKVDIVKGLGASQKKLSQ